MADKGTKLGDIFGLWNTKAVLVECKHVPSLTYSTLKDHQHENLRKWVAGGGRAIIAWVRGKDDIVLVDYPLDFAPGQNINLYVPLR